MRSLKDRVALVTGASKGIGAQIAKDMALAGASVIVNYNSSSAGADKVVSEIVSLGGKAIASKASIGKSSDIEKMFKEAVAHFGRLDVLVNNAGVFFGAGIEQITEEHYRSQFDLNVFGTILATKEAMKYFGADGGSIINISSLSSQAPNAGLSVYSATKGAINTLTQCFAVEFAPRKVRVNAIMPGFVDTEGSRAGGAIGGAFEKHMVAITPLGRVGLPSDISPLAVFLASEDSRWLTGEIIRATGGMR
jgi:3-oxoacyl-[acyl-carrier protein] reductase